MITEAYNDILLELDLLEVLRVDLVRQLHQNYRVIWTGMAPSDPMPVHVPLDKALSQRNSIMDRLLAIESEIKIKQQLKQQIEDGLQRLTGVQHTIVYKRDIERKSLRDIADELGFSYSYVSKISAKSVKPLLAKS